MSKYSLKIFEGQFKKRCIGYKETYEMIEQVLDDAREAQWVKLKSSIKKLCVTEEQMEEIHTIYIKNADYSYVKKNMEEAYNYMLQELGGRAADLAVKDACRKSTQFQGGGVGLEGAVLGMATAGIMNVVYSAVSDAVTRGSAENIRKHFTEIANRLFTGEEMMEEYKNFIKASSNILHVVCRTILFSGKLEEQTEVEDILQEVNECINEVSGDELRKLASNLIFVYPGSTEAYVFALEHFVGIKEEIFNIAQCFGVDEDISYIYEMFGRTKNCIVLPDIQLYAGENTLLIDFLSCAGNRKYRINVPISTAFIDKKSWDYEEGYMINHDSGIGIRYWTGSEGMEIYDKEVKMTSERILEYVNGWGNINIKDFSQQVQINISKEYFTWIVRGEVLYRGSNDMFIFIYCDYDIFFNLCIGCSESMGSNARMIEDIIRSVNIIREPLDTIDDFFGYSKAEVLKKLQNEQKEQAKLFLENQKDKLDFFFMIAFRKNFKALLKDSAYENKAVYRYDYEIDDQSISDRIEDQVPVGQYVLYCSDDFVITDYVLIARNINGEMIKYGINEIAEILPVEEYEINGLPKLCVRNIDGSGSILRIKKENLKECLFVSGLINSVLRPLRMDKVILYYTESQMPKQKEVIFCTKCKEMAYVRHKETLLSHSEFCRNCGAENRYIYRILKNKEYRKSNRNLQNKIVELTSTGLYESEEVFARQFGVKDENDKVDKKNTKYTESFVKEYIVSMNGTLDYQSAALYRTLFKNYFQQNVDNNELVNFYDYQLSPFSYPMLMQTLHKGSLFGQYVLYNSRGIILTDFYLYICADVKDYIYPLNALIEVMPMEEYIGHDFKGICVHTIDDKFEMIEDDYLSNASSILDDINIILEEAAKYRNEKKEWFYYKYENENKESYVFCKQCKSWAIRKVQPGAFFNDIYCSKCEYRSINSYYSKIKNDKIGTQKNRFKALFQTKIDNYIKAEISKDISNNGWLEFGIELQKRRQEEEKRKEEEEKKKREEEKRRKEEEKRKKEEEKRKEEEEKKKEFEIYIEDQTNNKAKRIKERIKEDSKTSWNALVFSLNFRQRFKVLCHSLNLSNEFMVWKYGYCIENEQTRNLLEYAGLILDYVLYYDGKLLLTDRVMYICSLKQGLLLESLREIVCYKRDNDYKMYIIYGNSKIPVEYNKVDIDVALLINISLEPLRNRSYDTKYDKYKQCCCYCNSEDITGGVINWYCNSCGKKIAPSRIYLNFWNWATTKSLKKEVNEDNIRKYLSDDFLKDEKNDFEIFKKWMEQAESQKDIKNTNSSKTICPHCGKQILCTVKFCNFCGQTIEQVSTNISKIFCVYCGKEILREAKFCNYCGKENEYGRK